MITLDKMMEIIKEHELIWLDKLKTRKLIRNIIDTELVGILLKINQALIKVKEERKFVTGNIKSQEGIEKAYRDGWDDCYNRIKTKLAEKFKNES